MLTQFFKKAIASMILEKAHELLQQPANSFTFCEKLPPCPAACRHQDFCNLSSMTDISIPSLKRMFKGEASTSRRKINTINQEKITRFLDYESWSIVEQEALQRIIKRQKK